MAKSRQFPLLTSDFPAELIREADALVEEDSVEPQETSLTRRGNQPGDDTIARMIKGAESLLEAHQLRHVN